MGLSVSMDCYLRDHIISEDIGYPSPGEIPFYRVIIEKQGSACLQTSYSTVSIRAATFGSLLFLHHHQEIQQSFNSNRKVMILILCATRQRAHAINSELNNHDIGQYFTKTLICGNHSSINANVRCLMHGVNVCIATIGRMSACLRHMAQTGKGNPMSNLKLMIFAEFDCMKSKEMQKQMKYDVRPFLPAVDTIMTSIELK